MNNPLFLVILYQNYVKYVNKYNIFRILKKTNVSHIQTATVLHCLILKEGDRTVVYTCTTFKEP